MKNNRLLLCGLLLASAGSQAVTIDLRHEWLDDSKQNKDRAMVSHRFANGFGFSLEAKWKSGGDNPNKPFNNLIDNGTESTISYQYKVTPAFFLQPGFTLESSSDNSIYKPFLTAGYTFDSGLYFNARYRYEYTRYTKENTEDRKPIVVKSGWDIVLPTGVSNITTFINTATRCYTTMINGITNRI